ncbi:ADP-ribosylglycohydrolase family protein [Nonomuraea glycinis]|uniref:ADP-ribosylglycohydrolase family protein n=1 Tax=Nonomuraea glycinis TaxID=2047744 RepID=UPI0033AB834F
MEAGRVRGCVLGGAVGDALGAPIEFESLARIRALHGRAGVTGLVADWRGKTGLVTDDTQLTLFTLEGLIRADVRATLKGICHHPSVLRSAYLRWLDTQRYGAPPAGQGEHHRTGWLREQGWLYSRRAPGNACLSGLRVEPDHYGSPGLPGPVNPRSKGCGTVMRSAPFGLLGGSPRQIFDLAAECAQITHGHPTGQLAAGAFAVLIHHLMHDAPLDDAVAGALEVLAAYPAHEETTVALRAATALARKGDPTPEKLETLGGGWVAEEALAMAVYCAMAQPDVERALLLAVNHSGDSDSTGAMCGNILGLVHGESALPGEWLNALEGRATITELSDDFVTQLTHGHRTTRRADWLTKYPGA